MACGGAASLSQYSSFKGYGSSYGWIVIPHDHNIMSVVHPRTPAPNGVASDETLHFDYPGSDIVLHSRDSHYLRVLKLYVVNSSPVLQKLIQSVSRTSHVPNGDEQVPLPVVKLPESGATLHSLLTFIFPVVPILPSTPENIMELLAVAQKYQMGSVLTHIRGAISRQDQPFIRPETALHHYFLAQQHGLHEEALQAAQVTLRLSMTLEDLGDKLEFPGMSGAYLHELWKYHEQFRIYLKSGILEFRSSGLPDDVKGLRCTTPQSSEHSFPRWLDDYIESIAEAPHLFDLSEFEDARAHHMEDGSHGHATCSWGSVSSQAVRAFWEALTAVINTSIEKADLTLALVKEESTSENSDPPSLPLFLDTPDANVVVRSSDQANFCVHKSVLAMSSPSLKNMVYPPQPLGDEVVDGLPVVSLTESADLLNSLISLLYPISPVIPGSYEKVFALLAACQKYNMVSVQSNIRAEVKRGTFPAPVGPEVFSAYAMASSMGLIPEMESTARLTLGYPMTFESLGERLRSFEGRALCDLVRYRKRCRDNLVSNLDSFFDGRSRCRIWAGCEEQSLWGFPQSPPTSCLRNVFTSKSAELKKGFTHATFSPSTILEEYLVALKNHTRLGSCNSCAHVEGQTFLRELEDELEQALDKPRDVVIHARQAEMRIEATDAQGWAIGKKKKKKR